MIRLSTSDDLLSIATILVKTWKSAYQNFLPKSFLEDLDISQQVQRHQKKMQAGIPYLVAENENGTIIGFASFGPPRSTIKADYELYTLYVDPTYQHQGMGQKLLESVIVKIGEPDTSLLVEVMEKNPYQSFYFKNGFQKIGTSEMDLGTFKEKNLLLINVFKYCGVIVFLLLG